MRIKENHDHEARPHTMTNCDQLLVQQVEVHNTFFQKRADCWGRVWIGRESLELGGMC